MERQTSLPSGVSSTDDVSDQGKMSTPLISSLYRRKYEFQCNSVVTLHLGSNFTFKDTEAFGCWRGRCQMTKENTGRFGKIGS